MVVVVQTVPKVVVVVPTVVVIVGWAGVMYDVAEAVMVTVPGVEERNDSQNDEATEGATPLNKR